MTLLLIVLLPFLGALLPPLLSRRSRYESAWAAGIVTAVALALLLTQAPAVFAGDTLLAHFAWLPALDLNLSFRLDGLGLLFALLILGIGLLVILYARYYLRERDPMGRFYAFLLLFMGSMLGIVLSENLLLLVVFWELTSLSSFLLIGYWKHHREARQGARMALAITGGGGLALLGGVLLLHHITGSFDLSVVLNSADLIQSHPLYVPTLVLILLGAFTKSAQFPFHFWLPSAMAAPTPVSAYLHSATMVKAGVFLLARLFPALAGTDVWFYLVGLTGLTTFVLAAYGALFRHDLKGLLAYSTISHLGLITLLFGFGTPLAAVAGVFHIINHATFKASLFMAAGIIDHETGTRDMRRLGGLWRYMPHTALLALVSASAMAGVPLLNGFLSKEMFFAETLALDRLQHASWLAPLAATLGGILSVAYAVRFMHDVFFGPVSPDMPRVPHEPPRWMKIPVEILAILVIVVGILPAISVGPLLAVSAQSVLGGPLPAYSLAIWHGFNLPVFMSLVALVGGVFLYSQRRHLFALHDRMLPNLAAKQLYEGALAWVFFLAGRLTNSLQTNSLQRYLVLLLTVSLILGAYPFLTTAPVAATQLPLHPWDAVTVAIWVLLAAGAIGTVVLAHDRFIAVIVLGVVGLAVSLLFVRFSAPDLALTQLSVEIVTIVLLLLALFFLPKTAPRESSHPRVLRDLAIAGGSGIGIGALSWATLTRPLDTISGYYLEQSLPGGGGSNVVNVILVDFRGFDTLGEITVLAIAALGIYLLLDGLRLPHPPTTDEGQPWAVDRHPLILALVTRAVLPLTLLVAIYILLRGHNLPGGGFIAGLITGVALIMQYLASGIAWAQSRLRLDYQPVAAAGLLIAAATGFGSWAFDAPFLTSTFGHLDWPIVGEFELASAMLFDLGVFLTVVGAVMLILATLGQVSSSTDHHAAAPEVNH